jgi:hypothetical protein
MHVSQMIKSKAIIGEGFKLSVIQCISVFRIYKVNIEF